MSDWLKAHHEARDEVEFACSRIRQKAGSMVSLGIPAGLEINRWVEDILNAVDAMGSAVGDHLAEEVREAHQRTGWILKTALESSQVATMSPSDESSDFEECPGSGDPLCQWRNVPQGGRCTRCGDGRAGVPLFGGQLATTPPVDDRDPNP